MTNVCMPYVTGRFRNERVSVAPIASILNSCPFNVTEEKLTSVKRQIATDVIDALTEPSSGTSKFNVSEKGPEPIPVFPNIPVDPSKPMNAAVFACVEVVKAAAKIQTTNNILFMKASHI